MSDDEILTQAKKLIAKVCGLKAEQIRDDDSFDSLELDSLSRIELSVEVGRHFSLDILEEEEDKDLFSDIKTVKQLVQFVRKYLPVPAA